MKKFIIVLIVAVVAWYLLRPRKTVNASGEVEEKKSIFNDLLSGVYTGSLLPDLLPETNLFTGSEPTTSIPTSSPTTTAPPPSTTTTTPPPPPVTTTVNKPPLLPATFSRILHPLTPFV